MSDSLKFRPIGPPEEVSSVSVYSDLIKSASEQRSQDWHQVREGRFTSSKFGLLMTPARDKKEAERNEGFGASAVSYIMEKAMEVYSGVSRDPDIGDLYSIRRGRILEAQGVKFYQLRENDDTVELTGFYTYGKDAGGSPDFKSRKVGIAEVKCPKRNVHDKYVMNIRTFDDLKDVEPKYWWQLQKNMHVTGVPFGAFLSFDPTHLKSSWSEIDWEGFNAEQAFEVATPREKALALHLVLGEMDPSVPEIIDSTLIRAVRLRDRFVNQLMEAKG